MAFFASCVRTVDRFPDATAELRSELKVDARSAAVPLKSVELASRRDAVGVPVSTTESVK